MILVQAVKSCYILNSFKTHTKKNLYIITSLSDPNKLYLGNSHSLFDTGFDGLLEFKYGTYLITHCTTKKN